MGICLVRSSLAARMPAKAIDIRCFFHSLALGAAILTGRRGTTTRRVCTLVALLSSHLSLLSGMSSSNELAPQLSCPLESCMTIRSSPTNGNTSIKPERDMTCQGADQPEDDQHGTDSDQHQNFLVTGQSVCLKKGSSPYSKTMSALRDLPYSGLHGTQGRPRTRRGALGTGRPSDGFA